MRRSVVGSLVLVILIIIVITIAIQGNAQSYQSSQEYVCEGYSQGQLVSINGMKRPVVGYISSLGRWVTFERGEVLLDHDVKFYFTWDGLEWTFNYLPLVGDLVEVPYDYELWTTTSIAELNTSLIGAFNQGYLAPNCWSVISHSSVGERSSSSSGGGYKPLPRGTVGDF